MTTLWIIFVVIQVCSIAFALMSLLRLYGYIKRYRFDESKYTLLFGFVHLRLIATAYFFVTLASVAASAFVFNYI